MSGADQVIRAQDLNDDCFETLSVENDGNDWYTVKYRWNHTKPDTETRIPVKAVMKTGRCRIVDILVE